MCGKIFRNFDYIDCNIFLFFSFLKQLKWFSLQWGNVQGLQATSGLAGTTNTRTWTDPDDKPRAKAGQA